MKISAGIFFQVLLFTCMGCYFWHKDVTIYLVTKIKFSAFLEEV